MTSTRLKKFLALSLTMIMALALLFTPVVTKAEESKTLTSYLDDFFQEEALEDWLAQVKKPFGQELDMTFDLGPGFIMDAQSADILNSLGFKLIYQADFAGSGVMSYDFNLYKKDDASKALNMAFSVLDNGLLIEFPGILSKPIFVEQDEMEDLAGMALTSPAAAEGSGMMAMPVILAQNGEQAKADFLAAKDNYLAQFDDQGETSTNFVVGNVNEDLTVHSRTLAAEKMVDASVEFLTALKDSAAITAITDQIPYDADELPDFGEDFMPNGGGSMDEESSDVADDDSYEDFYADEDDDDDYYDDYLKDIQRGQATNLTQLLDEAILTFESGDIDPMAITWEEYKSAEDENRGFNITLEKASTSEKVGFYGFNVKSADQLNTGVRFALSASPSLLDEEVAQRLDQVSGLANLFAFQLVDELNADSGTSSGNFTIDVSKYADMLSGSYVDLSIVEQEDNPDIFLGQLDMSIKTIDQKAVLANDDAEDDTDEDSEDSSSYKGLTMVEDETITSISLQAYMEGEDYKLDLNLLPDTRLEDQYIKLYMQPRFLPVDEISLPTERPADYYDISDDEDMQALEEDEDIYNKIMEALSDLGLNEE